MQNLWVSLYRMRGVRHAAAVIEQYAAVSPAERAEALDLLKREKRHREGRILNATVNAPMRVHERDS